MIARLRRLAVLINPFQPIRLRFPMAVALTLLSGITLGNSIATHWTPGIVIGAFESLMCPLGPAAHMLYRRVRR